MLPVGSSFPRKKFAVVMLAAAILLVLPNLSTFFFSSAAGATNTMYARPGAYAEYSVLGGFIPFFDGVNGTLVYTVTNVFSNGSMAMTINGNVSEGSELPVGNVSYGLNDNTLNPKIFPAISPAYLTTNQFVYENVTCHYDKNTSISVPAGSFNTMEYTGINSNGTEMYFWFDGASGLVIEMAEGGGAFQLIGSNIVTPIAIPSGFAADLPSVETLGAVLVGGGLFFFSLRSYYNHKASKNGKALKTGASQKR